MFRFDYSVNFLRWALTVPGYDENLHLGLRSSKSNKLMAFISGIPAKMSVHHGGNVEMVEINFLCVHKKLRSKRLAPVLIKEVTRRVNLKGIFQAVYTAGITLPQPVASCRYWHRSINPKKLIDIGSVIRPCLFPASCCALSPSTPPTHTLTSLLSRPSSDAQPPHAHTGSATCRSA